MSDFPRPEGVDLLANLLLGPRDDQEPLPDPSGTGPRKALEEVVLPALRRPPCLVSFSGGRDSSAVLAVAVDAARRHDLPLPVPAIMRFRDAPETEESEWQQLVLDHLGARGAEVVELGGELETIGPHAGAVLRRHGLVWPANTYMHMPLLDLARGGSLLTGGGGDELFGTMGARHVLLARRRVRPRARDLRTVAFAALPRRVRERAWRALRAPEYPWLTAAGNGSLKRALARDDTSWPARWDAALRHWHRSRAFAGLDLAITALGRDRDVEVTNPFLQPRVLSELALAGGATGFPGRTAAMTQLFGDLLPEATLGRSTKAVFTAPLFGTATREFASAWRGDGVDPELVDVEAVRREWLAERPHFGTTMLLHSAWLSTSSS